MKRFAPVCLLAAVMSVAVMLLAGCGGPDKNEIPAPQKAISYVCENCGHQFGIPTDTPPKQRVFPPFVCPKCGERTAVEVSYYEERDTGKLIEYSRTKWTDEQIRFMERYVQETPEEELAVATPEMEMERRHMPPLVKYPSHPGSDHWFNPMRQPELDRPITGERERFRSMVPRFPKDWPIVEASELKQWK